MTTPYKGSTARVGTILCIFLLQDCAARPIFIDRDINFRPPNLSLVNATKNTKIFPNIDIGVTCSDAARLRDGDDAAKNCLRSETKAKDEFARLWVALTLEDVKTCVAPAWPDPSYVEMLTCVELNNERVAVAASGGGTVARPTREGTRLPADAAKVDTPRL